MTDVSRRPWSLNDRQQPAGTRPGRDFCAAKVEKVPLGTAEDCWGCWVSISIFVNCCYSAPYKTVYGQWRRKTEGYP